MIYIYQLQKQIHSIIMFKIYIIFKQIYILFEWIQTIFM